MSRAEATHHWRIERTRTALLTAPGAFPTLVVAAHVRGAKERLLATAERRRALVVFGAALALYAASTHTRPFAAGNDSSRWAHVESLVDYGRPSFERSVFRGTVDKVRLDGREYTNKPPLLGLAGAALYAPLTALTGWRLGDPVTRGAVMWVVTLLLVGVPAALTIVLFDRALLRYAGLDGRTHLLLTVALGTGSLFLSFGGTFNNHVPAACLLFAAVLAALDGRSLRAGLLTGLCGAIDVVPGFGFAPFLAAIAIQTAPDAPPGTASGRPALLRFALGLGAAVVIFVAGNIATTGWPVPPKMVPGAVDLAAQVGPSVAGIVLPQGVTYPLEILFGWHGLFVVSPVLLFGAAGLVLALRAPPFATRRTWVLLSAGTVFQIAAHAVVAGSYGGWSYGYRYLIPIQPLLLFAAPCALRGAAARATFAAVVPVSVLFAALGAYHPWPPGYEQATTLDPIADLVTNPIGGNAAAWIQDRAPGAAAAAVLGRAFVSPDPAARSRYYKLFFLSKGDFEAVARLERSTRRTPELRRSGGSPRVQRRSNPVGIH